LKKLSSIVFFSFLSLSLFLFPSLLRFSEFVAFWW
jgi:hypothetical protein